jgi:hypothetical protein
LYREKISEQNFLGNLRNPRPWARVQDNHLYRCCQILSRVQELPKHPLYGDFLIYSAYEKVVYFSCRGSNTSYFGKKYASYYIFWWYDNLLHILAGMAIGFFGLALFKNRGLTVGLALVIGIAWEIFERVGHIWWPKYVGFGGTWDTFFDILCAIIGALIIILVKNLWQKNNTTRI